MSKFGKDNKTGPDVLRAIDVIPPFDRPAAPKRPAQRVSESDFTDAVDAGHAEPALPPQLLHEAKTGAAKAEIPKFDLADGLLAGRRMVSAARRRSPNEKTSARLPPVAGPKSESDKIAPLKVDRDSYYRLPIPGSPQQRLVIADIVARDIDRLCRGDVVSVFGQDFRVGG